MPVLLVWFFFFLQQPNNKSVIQFFFLTWQEKKKPTFAHWEGSQAVSASVFLSSAPYQVPTVCLGFYSKSRSIPHHNAMSYILVLTLYRELVLRGNKQLVQSYATSNWQRQESGLCLPEAVPWALWMASINRFPLSENLLGVPAADRGGGRGLATFP